MGERPRKPFGADDLPLLYHQAHLMPILGRGVQRTQDGDELGAALQVLQLRERAAHSPHTFLPSPATAQQRFTAPAVPSMGTHLHLPSPAPAWGRGGGNRHCSVSAGEHRDQGSSIVYYQYLSWLGGTACWRKRGRGRAPNILCIPCNESKASAVAPVLGVNQM